MNIGLMLMMMLEPAAGRIDADLGFGANTATGMRAARSLWAPRLMETLRWLRVPGDTLFAIGAIAFVVFIFGLKFGFFVKPGTEAPAVVPSGEAAAR